MKSLLRLTVALAVLAAVATGAVLLVRGANGDYSGDYTVHGTFPRAGEGLQSGSEVVFRGVQVGRVSGIALDGTRAEVTMLIDPGFHVPASALATVNPVNLFGAEQVTLTTAPGPEGTESDAGPYVAPGGSIARTASSDELGDLFAAAAPLLDDIDTENLSAVLSDLAQFSDGEGPSIAQGIGTGAQLAAYLNQTLAAQLATLDSFSRFSASVAPDGPLLNGLSAAENAALPTFNADAADFQRLMDSLTPFANQLARLLSDYHPDIATLLTQGADVAQVLTAQQANIGQVIEGAYQYAYKVGQGGSADTLPNGSKFAYFNTFILFTDVNNLVCDLLAPPVPGLSFLAPLQQALSGAGTPFDCQSQLSAFTAAQATPAATTLASPAAVPAAPTAGGAAAGGAADGAAASAARTLTTQVYRIIGQPSVPVAGSIGTYVKQLLDGGL